MASEGDEAAMLIARLREMRPDLCVVPREMSHGMFTAGLRAKINGTAMSIANWIEAAGRNDLEALGIPWPESPWDRDSVVSDEVNELLLSTAWRAAAEAGEREAVAP